MKKRVLSFIGVSVLSMAVLAGCGSTNGESAKSSPAPQEKEVKITVEPTTIPVEQKAASISMEEAKTVAIKDAQLKETDVQFTKESLEKDDGREIYEIDFYAGEWEYDYEIAASDGSVIQKDKEKRDDLPIETVSETISLEDAKAIALKSAGLEQADANAITWRKEKQDQDDGIAVYELEFYYENTDYEYEIKADDGSILSQESEPIDQDDDLFDD